MSNSFEQEVDSNLQRGKWSRTGFGENFQAAVGKTADTMMSISRYINEEPLRERRDIIRRYREIGGIPDSVWNASRTRGPRGPQRDYDMLARYVNATFQEKLLSEEEIRKRIRSDVNQRVDYASGVFERQTGAGAVGEFMGEMTAYSVDPVLLPSYFVGGPAAARGISYLASFGRAAAATGAAEMGLEAINQPIVYDWNDEIGQEYTVTDALSTIALAGIIPATVSGTSASIRKWVKKFDLSDPDSAVAAQAARHFADELDKAPDPKQPVKDFVEQVDGEVKYQNTRGPAASTRKVNDIEPEVNDVVIRERTEKLLADYPNAQVPRSDGEGTEKLAEVLNKMDQQEARLEKALRCLTGG